MFITPMDLALAHIVWSVVPHMGQALDLANDFFKLIDVYATIRGAVDASQNVVIEDLREKQTNLGHVLRGSGEDL